MIPERRIGRRVIATFQPTELQRLRPETWQLYRLLKDKVIYPNSGRSRGWTTQHEVLMMKMQKQKGLFMLLEQAVVWSDRDRILPPKSIVRAYSQAVRKVDLCEGLKRIGIILQEVEVDANGNSTYEYIIQQPVLFYFDNI